VSMSKCLLYITGKSFYKDVGVFLQVRWHCCPALLHCGLLLAQHVLRKRVPLHEVLVDKLVIGAGQGLCAERSLTTGMVLAPSNELIKCLHLGVVAAGVEAPGPCHGVGANGGTGQARPAMTRVVTPARLLHWVAARTVLVWTLTTHVSALLAVPAGHAKARLLDSAWGGIGLPWVHVGVLGVFLEQQRRCHPSPTRVTVTALPVTPNQTLHYYTHWLWQGVWRCQRRR
jgi:hypothetical protein